MNNENLMVNKFEEEGGFDIKTILMKLLINWKWFVVSVVVCIACAFIYLRYATPVYRIQATVMINDDKKGSFQNQMMAMQDFGFVGATGSIDNEIEVLRSKSMIKQAVLDKEFYVTYRIKGRIREQVIYGSYPVNLSIAREDLDNMTKGITLEITQPDSVSYEIAYEYVDQYGEEYEYNKKVSALPYVVESPIGQLVLSKGEAVTNVETSRAPQDTK